MEELEMRVKARTGEAVPPTLRNLALLDMCPTELYKRLMEQPAVAMGTLSFSELENLIMTSVHNKFNEKRSGLHSLEDSGEVLDDEFF